MDNGKLKYNIGNTIEIHYCFNDDTHIMNATVLNRCNYEALNIIKEVGRLLSVEIVIETEPLGNGGIKVWFKIKEKTKSTNTNNRNFFVVCWAFGEPYCCFCF